MKNIKTVLLTGGLGYIGSHIAVDLIESGYEVVIADNLSNSHPWVIENIKKITGVTPKLYIIDVADENELDQVFKENDIDGVIHLAGYKAVGESVKNPLDYYQNNLNATISLLKAMKKHDVKNVVFSSSATVYGVPEKTPITEDMPLFCTNPYGWTKLMGEQIFRDAAVSNKDLSVIILRYFNPVGAHKSGLLGERPVGVPNNLMPFICDVAEGKQNQLLIFGDDYPTPDGTGVRDYIHVVDLSKGHLKALDYVASHPGVSTFNLGTGKGYSVLEMVKSFEKANDIPIKYEIVKRRDGDVASCYSDPSKANEVLGWKAELGIEDMCRDAWNFAKNNR